MTLELSGIKEIDEQHLGLFVALKAARDHVKNGYEFSGLLTLLSKLEDYADKHFAYEEQFLLDHNYSGYEEQKRSHDAFRQVAHQYVEDLKTSAPTAAVLDFVEIWLIDHTNKEAVEYRNLK